MKQLPPLIVILGPTASGKTQWSLAIAKNISGEIISADSRQIYKSMDIGTAKEPGELKWKWNAGQLPKRVYMIDGIPHFLIDTISPKESFSVSDFKKQTTKHIEYIQKRKNVPLIVGGTGLYIQSVVDNFSIPEVSPNEAFRAELAQKEAEALVELLRDIDPVGAAHIDTNNRRRLIRAIEVTSATSIPFSQQKSKGPQLYNSLQIGIHIDRDLLYTRINTRVDTMMDQGLLAEVTRLKEQYDWDLPGMKSVGYRQFQPYFSGEITLEACIENLKRDTRQFARRQLTWFRRDKRIVWCSSLAEAEDCIDTFLSRYS